MFVTLGNNEVRKFWITKSNIESRKRQRREKVNVSSGEVRSAGVELRDYMTGEASEKTARPAGRGRGAWFSQERLGAGSSAIEAVGHSTSSFRFLQLRKQVVGGRRMAGVSVLVVNGTKVTRPGARSAGIAIRHHVVRNRVGIVADVVVAIPSRAIIAISSEVAVSAIVPIRATVTINPHCRGRFPGAGAALVARVMARLGCRRVVPSCLRGRDVASRSVVGA